jgi:hypothetical protein
LLLVLAAAIVLNDKRFFFRKEVIDREGSTVEQDWTRPAR